MAENDSIEEMLIEPLVARWRKLPIDARGYARGYMSRAVDQAAAALDIAEEFAAERTKAAARVKSSNLRVVPKK